MKKLFIKKCLFCLDSYTGRSYQLYCSLDCQSKAIYMRRRDSMKKSGSKAEFDEVECDVCGEMFMPKRINSKRCSDICRLKYRRNFISDRNMARARKYMEQHSSRPCAVCGESYQGPPSRKTCSSACAKEYITYAEIKKRRKRPQEYVSPLWPLPLQEPVEVTPVSWPPDSQALSNAVSEFLAGGGKIRKYAESRELNLLNDNPNFQNDMQEAEDQLHGTARAG